MEKYTALYLLVMSCFPFSSCSGLHRFWRFGDPLRGRFPAACDFFLGLGELICKVGFQVRFFVGLGVEMTPESEVGCAGNVVNTTVSGRFHFFTRISLTG